MSVTPPSVPAPRPAFPVRRLLWGAVLVIGIAAGVALLVLGLSPRSDSTAVPLADSPAGTWAAGTIRAPDFRLADQNGAPVSLAALRGRPVIVSFIDPLCRDYCPLEAKQLNSVVRSLPARARPAIVAVSVNVYGNARANLLQDAEKWNLVPQWRWGVGSDATLAAVWKHYHVAVLVSTKKIAGVTVHSVAHTEAAYLVDAQGYQRAVFLWPYRAEAVTRTLRSLASATP